MYSSSESLIVVNIMNKKQQQQKPPLSHGDTIGLTLVCGPGFVRGVESKDSSILISVHGGMVLYKNFRIILDISGKIVYL